MESALKLHGKFVFLETGMVVLLKYRSSSVICLTSIICLICVLTAIPGLLWAEDAGAGARSPFGPTARFHIQPTHGHACLTRFRFNASLSSDDLDSARQLQKRWDFDGDGSWDTEYSHSVLAFYCYQTEGVKHPRLLVRDNSGNIDSCQVAPFEVAGVCPPPDFTMTDINPFSPTLGESFTLSEQHSHRLLVWFVRPGK